jgi:hypothetical protein
MRCIDSSAPIVVPERRRPSDYPLIRREAIGARRTGRPSAHLANASERQAGNIGGRSNLTGKLRSDSARFGPARHRRPPLDARRDRRDAPRPSATRTGHGLRAAIAAHGTPEVLVSDGGGIFRATHATAIYAALGIEKREIDQGQRRPHQAARKVGGREPGPVEGAGQAFEALAGGDRRGAQPRPQQHRGAQALADEQGRRQDRQRAQGGLVRADADRRNRSPTIVGPTPPRATKLQEPLLRKA